MQQFLEIFLVGVEFAEKFFDSFRIGTSGLLSSLNLLLILAGRLVVRYR